MTAGSVSLGERLGSADASAAALAAHLDSLEPRSRAEEVRRIAGRQLGRIWELSAGAMPVRPADLVPAAVADGATVVYAGKNSLPLFTRFEKRFARLGGTVIGYNHQASSWATGPGYFTVRPAGGDSSGLLFDYTAPPEVVPEGWPAVPARPPVMGRLVFGNLHDFLRRVAEQVFIGTATRLGKPLHQYFILSRL